MRYGSKWPEYARQWDAMVINPSRVAEFTRYAQFAIAHKAEYLEIEKATGVTWPHIAVLHRRESDSDFNTYLGNGEPLNRVTRIVPAGRGPFSSFTAGAIDALGVDGLDKVIDWRLEKILYYCEIFNGLGYENKGLPSPYIWGGTNQQKPGKYVSDGNFDPGVMDTQPGCAPILQMIAKLDPSVRFVRETPMGEEPPAPPEPPMTDGDIARLVSVVERLDATTTKLDSKTTLMQMEMATLRSLVTGAKEPPPADPTRPADPKPAEKLPPITAPPPLMEPIDLKGLLLSVISIVAAPASGIAEPLGGGTIGGALPWLGAFASGGGLPSFLLNLWNNKGKATQ